MVHLDLENDYFEYLYNYVCGQRFGEKISYRKLLMFLHSKEFTYIIDKDENRADDGINLRRRFALDTGINDELDIFEVLTGPCSVLEMIAALAIRCEETIMDDPKIGDRTGQWFWGMINNLGLGSMRDDNFDRLYCEECVDVLLNRDYSPNGEGGLFTIKKCTEDLRNVEIWVQQNWYLNTLL